MAKLIDSGTRSISPSESLSPGPIVPDIGPTPGPTPITVKPKVVTLDPVTRIEGHLKVRVTVDLVQGEMQVVDAACTGTAFRGLEVILQGRKPWDAVAITQRVCGVCPVSHALAASLAIEQAKGVTAPNNARIIRNLVLASNFLQSHILHFYHLSVLDFANGPGMAPWTPAWTSDLRLDAATTQTLVEHYVQALAMRRKAHEMAAVYGGKLPHVASFVPGGVTTRVETGSSMRKAKILTYLSELITFIQNVWIPDVELLGQVYEDYYDIGRGYGNLLSYGVFDQDAAGTSKLLARGRVVDGVPGVSAVDPNAITEQVTFSWYADSTNNLPPGSGSTVAQYPKGEAYSWMKSPRYAGQPYELGPLARMWVNGDYREGISVLDRHMARALEALKVAQAMQTWVAQLVDANTTYTSNTSPTSGAGVGLVEAPRGALGHWLQVTNSLISRYQIVTPTCWNASPRGDDGNPGPIEQALIGTPVLDAAQPVEVLRVIHSFDPCLSCAVHVTRPGERDGVVCLTR